MFGMRALVLGVVLGLLVGAWGGCTWQKGSTALDQASDLKAQRDADRKSIDALRQRAVDIASSYEQANARLGAIAQQLEHDRENNRQFEQQQRAELAQLLEARPDLRRVRIGADLLRHWRQSNAGAAAATTAAAGAASQPARAVPGAAATGGRPADRPAGQP